MQSLQRLPRLRLNTPKSARTPGCWTFLRGFDGALGVITTVKVLAGVAALAPDPDPVSTGGKLAYSGRIVCAESSRTGKSGDIGAYSHLETLPRNSLKMQEICK